MKVQSKLTEAVQWIKKSEWDAIPVHIQRKFEIIDSSDGEVQDIVVPEVILDFTEQQSEDIPSIENMRKLLKEEGINVHWNLSEEKVKGIYYEHIKGAENG